MNTWCATGRMVEAAELKFSTSGKAHAKFRFAVDNGKNKQGEKDTLFVTVICFDQRAEFIGNYGGKGRLAAVTGRWTQRSYETDDGQKRTVYEVLCNDVSLLDKPKDDSTGSATEVEHDPFA